VSQLEADIAEHKRLKYRRPGLEPEL
jgi:hypothetical protein